jgi:hypothetical protein
MNIPFWYDDPSILLKKDNIFELWPTLNMNYNQKLNAITRLIIIVTIFGFIITMSYRLLFIGGITIFAIFVLFTMNKNKDKDKDKETFTNNDIVPQKKPTFIVNPETLDSVLKTEFKEGNKKNPFSNVLLTQIEDDSDRKPAPPSFNVDVDEDITTNVKKAVQHMNPGIKNTDKQLYGDLWENFQLDQSNRVFNSTPNTRVTNDQTAYAKYLYGTMPSAKGSTMEDNLQREKDNYRYTLY